MARPHFPNDLDGRESEGLGGFLEQPAVGPIGQIEQDSAP